MQKAILYLHGKGGNASEADHYKGVCEEYAVFGVDYPGDTPWETAGALRITYDTLAGTYESVTIVANSIGAYFAMNALQGKAIRQAFFISPIVNMEKLISDMMCWAGVTEKELREKGKIETSFGETLSWEYLRYVREHPICWNTPTHILYGAKDHLTSLDTVRAFAKQTNAGLTVMENGGHWFHTREEMAFLDAWIKRNLAESPSVG